MCVYTGGSSKEIKKKRNDTWTGFTQIELLVTIAIVAILTTLVLPTLARAGAKGTLRAANRDKVSRLVINAENGVPKKQIGTLH